MRIRPGIKARVIAPPNIAEPSLIIGQENIGIIVIVGSPADSNEVDKYNRRLGPAWHVTSISRPFQKFTLMQLGRKALIRKEGSFWNVAVPDVMLEPILEDPLPPEDVEEDAPIKDTKEALKVLEKFH